MYLMKRIIRRAAHYKKGSFFIFLLFAFPGFAQQYNITSPNKNITVQVSNDAGVSYSVVYNGKTVILPSPLGFELYLPAIISCRSGPMQRMRMWILKRYSHLPLPLKPVRRSASV